MKQLLLAAILILSLAATAQTSLISHKSHAGNKSTFVSNVNANFGKIAPRYEPKPEPRLKEVPAPPMFNESFQPVNDTTVVKLTTTDNNQLIRIDTISKKKTETVEDVKKMHSTLPRESWNNSGAEGGKKKNEVIMFTPPANGNTPSFLFIFGAVSVIGTLVYRIFFRKAIAY